MKEGQKIIFKHPLSKDVRIGVFEGDNLVSYLPDYPVTGSNAGIKKITASSIQEWCDAESAWDALTLQNVRAGKFGPTVEP